VRRSAREGRVARSELLRTIGTAVHELAEPFPTRRVAWRAVVDRYRPITSRSPFDVARPAGLTPGLNVAPCAKKGSVTRLG
jgi:hypothetical protein